MGKLNLTKVAIPTQKPNWDSWSYRIGCPVWGCKEWGGLVYPERTANEHYLSWYSHAFPTVEGNSTFYGVPGKSTFEKWSEQAAPGFQFCFKFPRRISHDCMLTRCDSETKEWLSCLEILYKDGKLGPTFLQLGPSFGFNRFGALELFLRGLPKDWPWAVEVRHQDWFDAAEGENRLDGLLGELEIDRVLFDSRPLNSLEASDAIEEASQKRKPRSPFRTTTTSKRPMLRLIGRNDWREVTKYWIQWADQIACWIDSGLQPWVFTHAPNDQYAPDLVKLMHRLVREKRGELPDLPELFEKPEPESPALRQLDLF
ncbi:MAG: DUF72 domain-containing protein [Pirellula sp.]|jgi:uncharacterized protein YecE (DUF72 family)